MSLFVSYRNIAYVPSAEGVRIVLTTDIACHAYLRITASSPRIHKKTSIIRGLPLKEDIRFCFVVYEDYEQFEGGDTLTHTFYVPDWPPCTTKWFYPFSSIASVFTISTGPFFQYHNTGVDPVPTPDTMYHLNSIDPELRPVGGAGAWIDMDLSYEAPLAASGVILYLENTNPGAETRVALRKPGAAYDLYTDMQRRSSAWVLVGLDINRKIQARAERIGDIHFYVMGYTGPLVVFPDTPIDIKPIANNTYTSTLITATWPDARFILTDLSSSDMFDTYHSIRPSGSGKELYQGVGRKWPFSLVGADGYVQTKLWTQDHPTTNWLAYAYIPDTIYTSLNGIDLGALPAGAWTVKSATPLSALSRWAFVEMKHPFSANKIGIRKQHSYFGDIGAATNHAWLITHVDDGQWFEMYNDGGAPTSLLLAST